MTPLFGQSADVITKGMVIALFVLSIAALLGNSPIVALVLFLAGLALKKISD